MKNRKKFAAVMAGIMAGLMLLSLILSLIPVAHAASSSEIRQQLNSLKEQQQDLQDKQQDLQEQYQENEDEIARIVEKKNLIDQEIFLLYSQISNINQQISAYNVLIADKQDELDEAIAVRDALLAKYKDRIRAMEEEGSISYWSVLFQANSLSDLLDRINMIEEIASADRRRLQELSDAADAVQSAQDELTAEKQELEETKAELDDADAELDEKRAEADALLTELLSKGEEIEGLLEEYERLEEEALLEIAQKEKELSSAQYQEWLATSVATTAAPTAATTKPSDGTGSTEETKPGEDQDGASSDTTTPSAPACSASWLIPCNYTYVSSPFGDRDAPTAGASSNHQGIDLAAPEGTPIIASRSGTVTTASLGSAAGYYVTISHGDGFSSIYMHMTHYVVSAGQYVSAGDVIGYVGKTGVATGNHLHFGISYGGKYYNPALYVNFY